MAVLSAASTASKPELLKMVLPAAPPLHRSKVSRLNSRASWAFRACGCTSPMACGSCANCRCPAATTRGLAWPAAATPKAAVKSIYRLPSASQTLRAGGPLPDDGPGAIRFDMEHVARFVVAQHVKNPLGRGTHALILENSPGSATVSVASVGVPPTELFISLAFPSEEASKLIVALSEFMR